MANFDEVVDKAKEYAQIAAEKSQEVYQVSKLKIEIVETKRKIDKNYASIGKKCYDAVKAGEDLPDFAANIEEIDLLKAEIIDKQEKIAEIKNTISCANCGADVDADSDFCHKCGAQM